MNEETFFQKAVDEMILLPDNDERIIQIIRFLDQKAIKKNISFYEAVSEYLNKKPQANILKN